MAPRPEHAAGFVQGSVNVGHIPDPESDRVGVEARIRKGQFFRVAAGESHAFAELALAAALATDGEHLFVNVAYRGVRRRGAG